MEIFRQITEIFSAAPGWVPLIVLPAVVIVAAVLFTLLGGRKAYPFVAVGLGAAGFALMCCMTALEDAFFYAGLFALIAALLRLLFFIPKPVRRKKATSREQRIYEKFRGEPLTANLVREDVPAKVCCFEEEERTEQPPELSHALSLLDKLRREKLSSSDRLETDVLARTVSALKGRTLTESEKDTLNDCLASVLKLTAKYKL